MSYLLGIDVGTSGVKAIVVDEKGTIHSSAFAEYPIYYPRPGWVEQNPEDWFSATVRAAARAVEQCPFSGSEIVGIGLSGQMHSSVLLDKEGNVIRPAILWNDSRTTAVCQRMMAGDGKEKLLRIAKNMAFEGFTAPKLVWMRENEPGNFDKIRWLLLPKDYVRFRMTGEIAFEISDAAGTLLLDVAKGQWSRELCERFDIPFEILPPLKQSIEVCGRITPEFASKTGLNPGTVVVGGGADNACGAVGAGIVRKGRALLSLGTSGVVLSYTDAVSDEGAGVVHMFNHAVPDSYYLMGVILAAGMSYSWYKETFGAIESVAAEQTNVSAYDLLNDKARKSPPGAKGVLFLPYLNGERTPHADGNARGVFFGLSSSHTKEDITRAVLEGVAYAMRDGLEIIRNAQDSEITRVRAIGGGARSDLWKQIHADILGVEVATINIDEGPAFGAALLAGVGAGVFSDLTDATEATIEETGVTEPQEENRPVYGEMYELYRELYPALKASYSRLAGMVEKHF